MKKIKEAFRTLRMELSRISKEREKLGRMQESLMAISDDYEDAGFSSLSVPKRFIMVYTTEELEMLDSLSLQKSKAWKEFFSTLLK